MNKKLLVVIASALVANAAAAQSAFEGFYGQVGTGYENNTVQNAQLYITGQGQSGTTSGAGTATTATAPLVIGLGYTYTIDPKFTLGVGVDYSALSSSTGNVTGSWGGGDSDSWNYKISNRYNVFLAPGYVISKDQLAYLKVGYSNEKVAATSKSGDSSGVSMGSSTTGGYVLGLGYKQMITSGIYAFGEANYYNYSKPTLNGSNNGFNSTLNPGVNAYNVLVGVGYKF